MRKWVFSAMCMCTVKMPGSYKLQHFSLQYHSATDTNRIFLLCLFDNISGTLSGKWFINHPQSSVTIYRILETLKITEQGKCLDVDDIMRKPVFWVQLIHFILTIMIDLCVCECGISRLIDWKKEGSNLRWLKICFAYLTKNWINF